MNILHNDIESMKISQNYRNTCTMYIQVGPMYVTNFSLSLLAIMAILTIIVCSSFTVIDCH